MQKILKDYYQMDVSNINDGYFVYKQQNYYITEINSSFMQVYSYYDFMIHMLKVKGYKIVKNCFGDLISQKHVLFIFHYESFVIGDYLLQSLRTIPEYYLTIESIKESWIQKIDNVRNEISKYSYSFQYDKNLNALMHYYCGLAENGISILNEIIHIQKEVKIPLSLSLKSRINPHFYQLLNPAYYSISTKSRHILNLLKSNIITLNDLKILIEQSYFHAYELLYLYARMFYASDFFDCVLSSDISEEIVSYYINNYKNELIFIENVKKTLIKYISLPEISWIEEKNML